MELSALFCTRIVNPNVMFVEFGRKCDVKYGKDVVENNCDHFDGSD